MFQHTGVNCLPPIKLFVDSDSSMQSSNSGEE